MTARSLPALAQPLPIFLLVCVGWLQIGLPPAVGQETGANSTRGDEDAKEQAVAQAPPQALFGGPGQVDNQMADDEAATSRIVEERLRPLDPYFEWKRRLQERRGIALSLDYSAAYLSASASPGEDEAGGGIARFYGSWELAGRESGNSGAFVWKVEHRHRYTTIAPQGFGFNLGYVGLIEPPFSNQGWRWTNFYWRQRWKEGRIAMTAGFLDATDYVDVYSMASPWTGFLNFAFSTGTLTLPVPNDAALGVAASGMVTDKLFVSGGIVDRNADPTAFWDGFETLFDDGETFKSLEIGWTTGQGEVYLNNTHLTLWQADERNAAGEAGGWGANFSWTRYLAARWLPFVRAGYADEGGSLMQRSVSTGFGYQRDPGGDLLGCGVNWGEVNEDTWGPGLPDQTTVELFYRWQLTPQLAITPDVQHLDSPALAPETSSIWVIGVRGRLAL